MKKQTRTGRKSRRATKTAHSLSPGPTPETELIDSIARLVRYRSRQALCGIGDDAAVLRPPRGGALLWTTDLLVEGVHFRFDYTTPRLVGRKSLAASLSDIAAMGGRPRFYSVALAVGPGMSLDMVREFYRGLEERALEYKTALVGGDTSRSPVGTLISVSVLGEAAKDKEIYRSGARPGDLLFVTGMLGTSSLGLKLLGTGARLNSAKGHERQAILAHLDPEPRCAEGLWLAERHLASAMLDISDGLSTDLNHLCRLSGTGAIIYEPFLPIENWLLELDPDPLDSALNGGEDYQLLFAVPAARVKTLERSYPKEFAPISCIGRITSRQSGIWLVRRDGSRQPLFPSGYDHFRSPER